MKNRGSSKYQFAPVFDNMLSTYSHLEMTKIVATDDRRTVRVGKGEYAGLRAGVALLPFVSHRADYGDCGDSIDD